ncbi:MAG: MFS transporter [Caldilineaceae bacterium]|nr:MFS transporter [Caldilineaceae bacterium]
MRDKVILLVIFAGALIVAISMGTRQSFGLFLQPVTATLGIGRELFSLSMAIQNLIFGVPLMGMLADRYGSRPVLIAGGVIYAVGLLLIAVLPNTTALFLALGVLVGLGLSSASYVVVLGAVAQAVPLQQRTAAFGLITAGGSFGMFAVVPLAQWLLGGFGWQRAMILLAVFVWLIALLAFVLPWRRKQDNVNADELEETQTMSQVLVQASRHSGFWLLFAGFFVCGFHVAFISTHMPAYLADNGLAPSVSATALALIGIFNMFGSYSFGWLGDRFRKKYLLSFLYGMRAVVIVIFLLLPLTSLSAIVFGAAIGFLWLATVPLTSGAVAQIFGWRYLSTLYGIVFFGHQLGAFMGVWLGGRVYDTAGNYDTVWMMAIALGVFAALIHLPIADRPLLQPKTAAQAA